MLARPRVRRIGLLGAALLTSSLALAVPSTAAPTEPASAVRTPGADERIDLSHDQVRRDVGATERRRAAPRWPRGAIRYHETIPAKWQWGLDQAIARWNGAGSRIRFVKVASRSRAQVTISYGRTDGADGLGGWTARGGRIVSGFVHLSPAYRRVDERRDEQRVWVGILLAHELGHVLGFDHTSQRCSLMAPTFYFGDCGPLVDGRPGYYRCRWIDGPLLADLIRRYGGRAARPPAECPTYPIPARLSGVTFSGGADGDGGAPVAIAWSRYADARATSLVITVAPGPACAAQPVVRRYQLPLGAVRWTDPQDHVGPACYRVQAVNRSGAGASPHAALLAQFARIPDAPDVGAPRWDAEDRKFTFDWSGTDAEYLVARTDPDHPSSCITEYDADLTQYLYGNDDGSVDWYPQHGRECVTLWVVTEHRVSEPSSVWFVVPPPGAPTVGQVTTDEEGSWLLEVTGLPPGTSPGIEVVPGACPATAPPDADFGDFFYYGFGGDVFRLDAEPETAGCALVVAVDEFGQPGAFVARPFGVASG